MAKSEKKGELLEKVVQIIEKSISPDAKVKHNIKLPDLTESSKKRQIDVAIWRGKAPRDTLTIVEVQDRGSQVDINTFDGWITKMRKVGAQHLICVSREEFPESIKNEAKKKGRTVSLVNIEKLQDDVWPVNIIDNCFYQEIWKFNKASEVGIGFKEGEMPHVKNEDAVFEYRGKKYSMYELIAQHIELKIAYSTKLENYSEVIPIHLPEEGHKLYYIDDGRKLEVTIDLSADIEHIFKKFPFIFSSYRQVGVDSPLGWVMEATIDNQGKIEEIKITLAPEGEGYYSAKVVNKEDLDGFISIIPKKVLKDGSG